MFSQATRLPDAEAEAEAVTGKRILLIEDDGKLAALVREYLEAKGFEVLHEATGDRAPTRILSEQPDLVILDLLLPGLDGLSVCRQVRPRFAGPILMLTALGEEVDEVVGLEVGADDYLVKPVRPRVLLARIQTLLRRAPSAPAAAAAPEEAERIELGALCIDPATREVRLRGELVELTTAEFELLFFLARHSGQVVGREQIYKEVRGIEWDGMDRSIDLRVTRLRRKLGDDAKSPELIKSVRGEGYLMAVRP